MKTLHLRNLGVIFDNHMSLDSHINSISKKCKHLFLSNSAHQTIPFKIKYRKISTFSFNLYTGLL